MTIKAQRVCPVCWTTFTAGGYLQPLHHRLPDTQTLLRLPDHTGQGGSVVTNVTNIAALNTEDHIARHQTPGAAHTAIRCDIHHHDPRP